MNGLTPSHWYEFWRLGDVNLDGKIDDKDLDLITDFLGQYFPACDLTEDHIVDSADLQIAASNYGLEIYSYFGLINPGDLIKFGVIALAVVAGGFLIYHQLKK